MSCSTAELVSIKAKAEGVKVISWSSSIWKLISTVADDIKRASVVTVGFVEATGRCVEAEIQQNQRILISMNVLLSSRPPLLMLGKIQKNKNGDKSAASSAVHVSL